MLSGNSSLLGALGGGALRLLPELLNAWATRGQHKNAVALAQIAYETRKAELAAQIEMGKSGPPPAPVEDRGAIDKAQAEAALLEQPVQVPPPPMKLSEVVHVWVRPAITYAFVLLYMSCKVVLVIDGLFQSTSLNNFAPIVWNDDDATILAGAIAFWFSDATLKRRTS